MADCCDFFSMCCCWCISKNPRDDAYDIEDHDVFHEQFESGYDPHRNLIYNVDRNAEPDIVSGHRRVVSQPMSQAEMPSQSTHRSLSGDAPFGVRPAPDQLPPYSSRPASSLEPQVAFPPAALQPGGVKRAERQSTQPLGVMMGSDVSSDQRRGRAHTGSHMHGGSF